MRLRLFSDSSAARRKQQQQQQQNRSSTGSALLLRDVSSSVSNGATWEDETKSSNLSRSPPPTMVTTKVSLQQGSTVGTTVCNRDNSVNQRQQTSPTMHQRPSSLALGSPDWLKTRPMRPPSTHIKTPKQHAPSGRFSLYDDRIMSQQLVLNQSGRARETRATSVPGDMNC